MKIAFLSGTSVLRSQVFSEAAGWAARTLETRYGVVAYRARGEHIVLNRHGAGPAPLPPHRINHRANIRALADLGFGDVVAFNSVGSLRPELTPGTLVSCADYVCIQQSPQTFHDDELKGGAPGIDNNLIPQIAAALAALPVDVASGSRPLTLRAGKIYVQTSGPRFETKAEIAIIRHWGDVVGMTAAHEADLCRELGLRYNSLAMIDNFANGLVPASDIDFEKFHAAVQANQATVDRVLARLVELFK